VREVTLTHLGAQPAVLAFQPVLRDRHLLQALLQRFPLLPFPVEDVQFLPLSPFPRFPFSPIPGFGFVLSDSGHLLSIFNNLVALFGLKNSRTERLLQGFPQVVSLPGLALRPGGTSGVFLLGLPVDRQRSAQLALRF